LVLGNGVGSCLKIILSHFSNRENKSNNRRVERKREGPLKGGDHVLDALGLADASVERSTQVLVKMLLTNSLVALLGLIFNQK
jgi:hypothetical protein